MAENLSASFVRTVTKPGKYSDGGNLYLQVTELERRATDNAGNPLLSITKSWLFRYSRFGKNTWMGLGPFPDVSLKEARQLASDERAKLRAGIDPLSDKRARRRSARLEAANMMTFAECATAYIEAHKAKWKNEKHVDQWRNTLTKIAGPVFGHVPVADVETLHVLRCLEPIWAEKTETASRLRGRVESVLNWATVRGYRQGDNPARWRGHLQELLPAPRKVAKVQHHPALPYQEIGSLMAELREEEGVAPRALEFLIVTATRTGEIIAAEWSEIDADVWAIPAGRMKAQREHRVPLSKPALKCLRAVEGYDPKFIFPGHKQDTHLSNMAMMAVLRRMGKDDITVHGFRSTFRDWCAETTNYPADVAEMALAHTLKNKTEAAYRRDDLFEKRRKLMNAWARYCAKK